ncbi:MAG: sugar ABC transporter ATP-binding protein [Mariniblastus sp.]|nr:sugar ABC transporter ATP-binding protein [Mariniblastus sp.]
MQKSKQNPLLRMSHISKAFPGIQALQDVSIELLAGEVLALIGENGAGKSTLIKTLGGAIQPDRGQIEIDGVPTRIGSPLESQQHGIGIIYQEFNLIPFLTVRENLFLGRARHSLGVVNARRERDATRQLFERLGASIHPDTPVAALSIAEQQLVEIAKALATDVKIVVMDEPTATLTPREVDQLHRVVRELTSQGIGVVYVSHRLNEILELTDRVVVLRDGEVVGQQDIVSTNRRDLIELMVGRKIEDEFPKQNHPTGTVRLSVEGLNWSDKVVDVNFSVRSGEILGLTGLMGAGRTELARLIAGAEVPDAGQLLLDGRPVSFRSPRQAIRAGICLLTEDRKTQGLITHHSIQQNFSLPNLDQLSRAGLMNRRLEQQSLGDYRDSLHIKMVSGAQLAGQLSGGNQQKLVLAKWLQRNCRLMIVDEPTRGIDVGAKYEIYQLMNELVAGGIAILMISSELPEVLGMADRVLVMRQGRIAGEIESPQTATQQEIMELAAG